MLVRSLASCVPFTAGDKTELREILHPDSEPASFRYSLAHARLPAGHSSVLHLLKSSEVYYILSGRGRMEIDGVLKTVNAADTIYIPPGSKQRIESLGPDDLAFLCIVDPAWKAEDEEVLG